MLGHVHTGAGRAGEGNHVEVRVLGDGAPNVAVPLHHAVHTLREIVSDFRYVRFLSVVYTRKQVQAFVFLCEVCMRVCRCMRPVGVGGWGGGGFFCCCCCGGRGYASIHVIFGAGVPCIFSIHCVSFGKFVREQTSPRRLLCMFVCLCECAELPLAKGKTRERNHDGGEHGRHYTFGTPALSMISVKMMALSGVCSLGLSTIVHPAARAGATLHPICVERH